MKHVVAFDLVNTVLDVSDVPREDVRAYVDHVYEFRRTGVYKPLELPLSWVFQVRPFPEAEQGLREIADKGYEIVTCSNLTPAIQWRTIEGWSLKIHGVVPLDLAGVFKTDPIAYKAVCLCCRVPPENVTFVTANKDFGDIEASRAAGMNPVLIRNPGDGPADILELAKRLPTL